MKSCTFSNLYFMNKTKTIVVTDLCQVQCVSNLPAQEGTSVSMVVVVMEILPCNCVTVQTLDIMGLSASWREVEMKTKD